MGNIKAPEGTMCTKSHEYALKEAELLKIGITDYAVEQLGDVIFVELPEVGARFSKGDVFGTIESVKAASDLYAPVSGTVESINENLSASPELVNEDPFAEGWIIKLKEFNTAEFQGLMPYDNYREDIEG